MLTPKLSVHGLDGTWVVRAGGAVIAETNRALEVLEGNLAPVVYFPRDDIAMAFLEPTPNTARCPSKGEARFWTVVTKSGAIEDAGSSYDAAVLPAAARLAGHIAFDAERVTIEEV